MNDQRKDSMVRVFALGLAGLCLAGMLAGCQTTAGTTNSGGGSGSPSIKKSNASFTVTDDANDSTTLAVEPDGGDAWLETDADATKNYITWTSSRSFAVKFVQIDDQTKNTTKKLGDESNGWNKAKVDAAGTTYTYKLKLDTGSGNRKKSIRGAKYLVKSPDNCDASSPGASCRVLDPVIIVRY